MNTKGAIEFLEDRSYGVDWWSSYPEKFDKIIKLLKRGEKFEAIVKEIDERLIPGNPIPYHNDLNIKELSTLDFVKLIIKDVKQKYFPEPKDESIKLIKSIDKSVRELLGILEKGGS